VLVGFGLLPRALVDSRFQAGDDILNARDALRQTAAAGQVPGVRH
jgi:hypothetical protein